MTEQTREPLPCKGARPLHGNIDFREVRRDYDAALESVTSLPPEHEIAVLTDRLQDHLTTLTELVRADRRQDLSPKAEYTLLHLRQLREHGPGRGPFATWVHMRALARSARVLHEYLTTRRGRPARPR